MFGWSKKEKFVTETAKLLHEAYFLHKKDADNLTRNHANVLFPAISRPEEGAIVLASIAYRIFLDNNHSAEADRTLARVWYMAAELVRTGVISKPTQAKIVENLPLPDGSRSPEGAEIEFDVSRVTCARAGWIFTFYWQIYLPQKSKILQASEAERASLEGPLRIVFRNPSFGVEQVSATYQAGKGSNDVLQKAMRGLPDHGFRWFRIGQVVNGLLDAAMTSDESNYSLAELAVRGNLSTGGVSSIDCDQLLNVGREIRRAYAIDASSSTLIELVGRLQNDLIKYAAKQDNFAEFEKMASRHGGVFISYSHADQTIVQPIAQRLESEEIAFWLDNNEVLAGTKVGPTLLSGIEQNCVFLLVLSPASITSTWVKFEIDRALSGAAAGTHIMVPILVNGLTPNRIPPIIQDTICIDFSAGTLTSTDRLLRTIRAHLVAFEDRRRRG